MIDIIWTERFGIYAGMVSTVILTIVAVAALIWAAIPMMKKQEPELKKRFWIYSVSRHDGTGGRQYYGVDFYNVKNPFDYRLCVFLSAYEAFSDTKERQDSGEYDVELLTKHECEQRLIDIENHTTRKIIHTHQKEDIK